MDNVTVVILSEGRTEELTKCLRSLTVPAEKLQIIVVGNGTEVSESLLQDIKAEWQVLNFPERLTSGEVRNRALELAHHDWVHFLDEEVYWNKDYYIILAPLLAEEKLPILGGPELPSREVNAFSHAMYLALSSPFCQGIGFSRYRMLGDKLISSDEEKLSSSNIFIRRNLLKDHAFPANYDHADMSFLLQKLKLSHHQEWYHPRLFVLGKRKANFLPLRSRTFHKGFERSLLLREKLTQGGVQYTIPALFVLFHFFVLIYPPILWPVYKLYLVLTLVVSVGLGFKAKKPWLFPLILFFHWFLIWEYGWGFLYERFSRKWTRLKENL